LKLSEYILENMESVFIHPTKSQKRITFYLNKFIDTRYDLFMRDLAGTTINDKNLISKNFLKRIDEVYESEIQGKEDYYNFKNIMNNIGHMIICMDKKKQNKIGFTDFQIIGPFMINIYKPCASEKDEIIVSITNAKRLYIKTTNYSIVARSIIEKGKIPGIELLMIPEIEYTIFQQSDNNYYYRGHETFRYARGSDKYYVLRISKEYYSIDNMNTSYIDIWNEVERNNSDAV